ISTGDNARGTPAQRMDTVLGKILRINKDGTIPSDNPFYGSTTGNNRAIFSLGLRNPFTFAIQPGTQTLFINDVGEDSWEEVNKGGARSNFGWPNTEGPTTNPAFVSPIYAFNHNDGGHAVIGADFYPNSGSFPSQYRGKYIFGDHIKGWIRALDPNTHQIVGEISRGGIEAMTDIDVGPEGALYYLERYYSAPGRIGRISATGSTTAAPVIQNSPQSQAVNVGNSVVFSVIANGQSPLSYKWQRNGVDIPGANGPTYSIASTLLTDNGARFRAIVSNSAGSATSAEATLTVNQPQNAPVPVINLPTTTTTYQAGQTITFSGGATDPQDGTLSASRLTWLIDFHHDTHTHPFLSATSGISSGSFVIPTDGEVSANTWFRIYLTATDSSGNSTTVFREVFPQKSTVSLASNISGLTINLDNQPKTTTFSFESVEKFPRLLSVPTTQTKNGITYNFTGWSDGVTAATRTVITPVNNTTYTANFMQQTSGGTPTTGQIAPINGDTYARGGTFAGQSFGSSPELQVKGGTTPLYLRESFIKFDLNTFASVTNAKLRLWGRLSSTGGTVPVNIFGSSNTTFNFATTTWNNRPASTGAAMGTWNVSSTTGGWFELDVSSYVRAAKAAGQRYVTFVFKGSASTSPYAVFNSSNAASNKPELRIS
ncbi:MAG TPA: PQQ-dependent sugar dehydrogenase, partial [Tepidisphaeraceae bacterium]|nr:PQQ-dependent sugar dehydrogenase [Tepidisphaeraceae bacterium]